MDINTFLNKNIGDWFSQRTIYKISDNQVDNSKANLTVNLLTSQDAKISNLAQQYHFNLDLSLGAIASQWDNSPDFGKPKQQGNSLVLLFSHENENNNGKIFRLLDNNKMIEGQYILAEDESLTLIIEQDSQIITERIWFATDNLRFRNTVIKQNNQVTETSFYSEIKRLVNKNNK